jgi:hypothetical protein
LLIVIVFKRRTQAGFRNILFKFIFVLHPIIIVMGPQGRQRVHVFAFDSRQLGFFCPPLRHDKRGVVLSFAAEISY